MYPETKIGIDIGRINRENRGIPIYTRNILKEFSESSNISYLHYPDSTPPESLGIPREQLVEIPFSGKYIPWKRIFQEQVQYPKFQNKIGLDVIWHPQNHSQFWTPTGYVCTLHDVLPLARPNLSKDLDDIDLKLLYYTRVKSVIGADRIITVSNFSKDEIQKYTGVSEERIVVIPNGIDHTIFNGNIKEEQIMKVKEKYMLPEKYLLTVGGYSPHKNLQTLVNAYKESILPQSGYGFVMVGPKQNALYSSSANSIEDYVKSHGLEDNIIMLDALPIEDLHAIYSGAKMFATASLYEGFGFPPLEAMACGVSTIVSQESSLPEVCGTAALYSNPHDEHSFAKNFNMLVRNSYLAPELIEKGKAQAKKYTWTNTANKVMEVLNEVGERHKMRKFGRLKRYYISS